MIARLRFMKRLIDAGLYELRGLLASAIAFCGGLGVLAALDPSTLPSQLLPFADRIHDLGKWALLVTGVAGVFVMQSKRVVPKLPPTGAPSLLDNEKDAA